MEMVSIIVPVYNLGNKLYKCIESMVNQDYENKEIIIIDDGSDKYTARVCNELDNKYECVKCVHSDNMGVSRARNIGISIAKGKYIFFADGDDYAESLMLSEMLQSMTAGSADIVITGYFFDIPKREKDAFTTISIRQEAVDEVLENKEQIKKQMVNLWDASLMYNVWNKLFRKELIDKFSIRFPEGKNFNEDRDFIREYLVHINRISIIKSCFYHYYREDEKTATGQYRRDMLDIRKKEYMELKLFFTEINAWDERAKEYVAREHFDRVVGSIEGLFHSDTLKQKERLQEIKRIVNDSDTKEAIKFAKPKSRKMKIIHSVYNLDNIYGIYLLMLMIYKVRTGNPNLFYRLRQAR